MLPEYYNKFAKILQIWYNKLYEIEGDSMVIIYILYLLLFVVAGILGIICMKIKMAGMNVSDFFRFILAVNDLDSLYEFSKNNKDMSRKQQAAFLKQAEKVFSAFEKIPSIIWEDEYEKYNEILERYKDIKVYRWVNA